jgi:hypothetical protein
LDQISAPLVNTVSPGFIETDAATRMIQRMADKDKSDYAKAGKSCISAVYPLTLILPGLLAPLFSLVPPLNDQLVKGFAVAASLTALLTRGW